MARYKGYPCMRCKVPIYKGRLCGNCKDQSLEQMYGLSFTGLSAKPTEKFWRAWRKDSDALKRSGLRVLKENGKWVVTKGQRLM